MLYRDVPGIGRVSALSLGSWRTFGLMEFEDVVAVLAMAFDAGIDFLDDCRYGTAVGIAPGLPANEVIVGRALKVIGRPRASYKLANKLWWDQYPRFTLRQQLERALVRLDQERVDLCYVDRFDKMQEAQPAYPFAYEREVISAATEMKRLIDDGIIGAWGICNARLDAMERIYAITDREGLPGPVMAQMRYSLADPQNGLDPLFRTLRKAHGMMMSATMPLAGGLLSGKYLPGGDVGQARYDPAAEKTKAAQPLAGRIAALAAETGFPPAALAIAYPLLDPDVGAVVFGARTTDQLAENLKAVEVVESGLGDRVKALLG